MDDLLKSVQKGTASALMELYRQDCAQVSFLCNTLIPDSKAAAQAVVSAYRRAFEEAAEGNIETKEDFSALVRKRALVECKGALLAKNKKAFRTPAGYRFDPVYTAQDISKDSGNWWENVLNSLPLLHKVVYLSTAVTGLPQADIAQGLEISETVVSKVNEAEELNLSRISALLGPDTKYTPEQLHAAIQKAAGEATSAADVQAQIEKIANDVTAPLKQKGRGKIIGIAAGIVAVIAILAIFILPSALKNDYNPTETPAGSSADSTPAPIRQDYTAVIDIQDYGKITVALDAEAAPETVENFVSLARSGFYDGLTFHRIIEGFMMQGGDPNGDGTGGSDKTIKGEFSANGVENNLSHTRGAISMARSSDMDSASSQFFIVHQDSPNLDGQYACFGYVTDGMDVVDAICEAAEPTDSNGTIAPEDQPVINSITITEGAPEA